MLATGCRRSELYESRTGTHTTAARWGDVTLMGVDGAARIQIQRAKSGEVMREQGISKAGNRLVRAMTVEIAWGWLRYQPRSKLSQWYEERFGGGGRRARKIGIVTLARKLLVELWKYLETGVIPEGAVVA